MYLIGLRYYDPEVGRWISPDDASVALGAGEYNLYAYCMNDPINNTDSTGMSPFFDKVGQWCKDHWKEVAIATAFIVAGAVVTALTAGAGTPFMAALGSALLSSAVQVGISMATSVVVGGLVSVAQGGGFFDNVGDSLASGYMWGGIFSGGSQILSGGLRFAKQALGYNGVYSKSFSLMNPDKLWHSRAGATLLKVGGFAIDTGRYGIHMHLFSQAHIMVIPWLVGIIELNR